MENEGEEEKEEEKKENAEQTPAPTTPQPLPQPPPQPIVVGFGELRRGPNKEEVFEALLFLKSSNMPREYKEVIMEIAREYLARLGVSEEEFEERLEKARHIITKAEAPPTPPQPVATKEGVEGEEEGEEEEEEEEKETRKTGNKGGFSTWFKSILGGPLV